MKKNEFYIELKEKAGFVANILAIASILITLAIFIYSKTISSDDLMVTYDFYELPFDYKKFENEINPKIIEKDTIPLNEITLATDILIVNKSDNRFKKIEIPLDHFISDNTQMSKGYVMHNGKMEYFKDLKYFTISNVLPKEFHRVIVFANSYGVDPYSIVIGDDKSFSMRQVIKITTENDFDNWLTNKVIYSKTWQIIIYLLSIIGIYFFVRNIIPFIFNLVPNKKTTGNNV